MGVYRANPWPLDCRSPGHKGFHNLQGYASPRVPKIEQHQKICMALVNCMQNYSGPATTLPSKKTFALGQSRGPE